MSSPMDSKYFDPHSPSERRSPLKGPFLDESSMPSRNGEALELRRKISKMELEQAEREHDYNEQFKDLQSHVTRLRASVEKGEVLRQKLEYELTLAQKATNQEKRKFAEKESSMQRTAASLKDKVMKLESEAEKRNQEFKTGKDEWEEERRQLKDIMAKRDQEISQLKNANQSLADGHRRLETMSNERESKIKELQDKSAALENQRNSQNDTVRRLMKDAEFSGEREERTRKELTALQDKLKIAEENIEAERAAHLETKFSSEILQLRVRDLEGALEVEKAALVECKKKLENVTKDNRDTEMAFEDQRDAHAELKALMTRKDEQFSLEINELTRELNEKIKNERLLSDQLEIHQKNFDSLKSELSEAKKQQNEMQSIYGDNMKELELLLENFRINQNEDLKSKKKSPRPKSLTPSIVLENLRFTLRDYQTRLKNSTSELERLKKTVENISSECSTYKEMSWTRDKALEEAQRLMKNSKKESARYKAECLKYENDLLQRQGDTENMTKKFTEQKEKFQKLRNEHEKLKGSFEKSKEEIQLILHSIYQQLVSGRVFIRSHKDKTMTSFSTVELSGMINEQLAANTDALNTANKKIDDLEDSLKLRDDALDKLQSMYDDAVKKASRKTKERENSWKRQKFELENHYKKIVEEMQSKSEKSQVTLDDVWAKLSEINQIKDDVENQNCKLRGTLHKSQIDNRCLLAACAMLSGGLWSTFQRAEKLIAEKRTLYKALERMTELKAKTLNLVSVLQLEMEGSNAAKSGNIDKNIPPILKFRKAVIAVLAVNRFHRKFVASNVLFSCKDWPKKTRGNLPVQYGGYDKDLKSSKESFTKTSSRIDIKRSNKGISWLSSQKLSSLISQSMKKLIEQLETFSKSPSMKEDNGFQDHYNQDDVDSSTTATNLISVARSAYCKMIHNLRAEYSPLPQDLANNDGFGDSLVDQLRIGLKRILIEKRHHSNSLGDLYTSSTNIMNNMNHHILAFTKRLHSAELERRSLRQDLSRVRQEREDVETLLNAEKKIKENLESGENALRKKLREVEDQLDDTVDVGQYQAVCDDLNMALKREEQAQGLLQEQTKQMEEMGKRMELHSFKGEEKDAALVETLRALTSCKNDLKTRDDITKKVQKEVSMLDNEKRILQQNFREMQNRLNSISRERELLTAFIRSAGTVLEQSRYQAMLSSSDQFDFTLPELVLPSEVLAMDGLSTSQDIKVCQETVSLFFQAQRQALNQIVKLNAEKQQLLKRLEFLTHEVQVNKEQVLRMKGDLRACQGRDIQDGQKIDFSGFMETMTARDIPPYGNETSPRNGYVALMVQPDSFAASNGVSKTNGK